MVLKKHRQELCKNYHFGAKNKLTKLSKVLKGLRMTEHEHMNSKYSVGSNSRETRRVYGEIFIQLSS